MIGYLKGTLLRVTPGVVLLDVGGVGYELHTPLSTYYEVQKLGEKGTAAFHVHTHVREDALLLFGFHTEGERRLFEKLISVSGIGPKLAQTALSGMSSEDLASAIAQADVRRLSTIPGVGKKTAERMALELKDKMGEIPTKELLAHTAPLDSDLVSALVNLGYKRTAAEKAAGQVIRDFPEKPFADQLRASLQFLSRG
jgi:Holliday junction DNA helicase RuvA